MIKYFRNAFKITNENIILTTPFILFLLLAGLFLGLTGNLASSKYTAIFLITTLLFMTAAFFAGWFYMVQKAIDISHENIDSEDKIRKSLAVMQTMTTGIGEYFLSFVFGIILMLLLVFAFIFTCKFLGGHFIGNVAVSYDALKTSAVSNEQLQLFLNSIPHNELVKISKWNFLILAAVTIFSFITMFWASVIIKTDKNAFLAFFKALSFTFKNFFGAFILFVYVSVLNFAITMLSGVCSGNNLLYFLATLVYFYFVVYIVVLIFLYYDEQQPKLEQYCDVFVKEEDFKKENNAENENENHSDNGTDSNGQE